ncbi:hypothetical protein [Moorena producens]|uniref:hypothetical protein n=1 Tax=Moorena producens TaxID=1155739 RepID=UPI003C71FBA6
MLTGELPLSFHGEDKLNLFIFGQHSGMDALRLWRCDRIASLGQFRFLVLPTKAENGHARGYTYRIGKCYIMSPEQSGKKIGHK